MAGVRADMRLVELGLCADKDEAARLILAGLVHFDTPAHNKVDKPGTQVACDTILSITPHKKYVSRGGDKLKGFLRSTGYSLSNKKVIDIGASTGGFTDCALQEGAHSVVCVDVGYGQLAWKLQSDERVTIFDRCNIRDFDVAAGGGPFDVAVADLSFVSLKGILPIISGCLSDGGDSLVLIKPQFEASRSDIGQGGIVNSPAAHIKILAQVVEAFAHSGLEIFALSYSVITGTEGNIEYWAAAKKVDEPQSAFTLQDTERVVNTAFEVHRAGEESNGR